LGKKKTGKADHSDANQKFGNSRQIERLLKKKVCTLYTPGIERRLITKKGEAGGGEECRLSLLIDD